MGKATLHKVLKRTLRPFFNLFLVFSLIIPYGFIPGDVFAYDFPSTNEQNASRETPKHIGKLTPYISLEEVGIGYVTLKFHGSYVGYHYFEYKIDDSIVDSGTPHQTLLGEFEYPGIGVYPNTSTTRTFYANEKVQIRLALGAENDWYFDWTRFDVLTRPPQVKGLTIYDGHKSDPEKKLGCGGYTNNKQIRVEWTPSNDPELKHYWFGTQLNTYHKKISHQQNWYNGNLTPGYNPYHFTVIAVNNDGVESLISETCGLIFDTTAPDIEFKAIRYQVAGGITKDSTNTKTNDKTPTIVVEATDTLSDIEEVYVEGYKAEYDGENWIANIIIPLNDGKHTLLLKAIDRAGNEKTVTQEIFIDTKTPTAQYTEYKDGAVIEEDIVYVKGVDQLGFTAFYEDPYPSSGLLYDSYSIFQAQDDGSFRFSQNGKLSYCGWRATPNRLTLTGRLFTQSTLVPYTNCIEELSDGEYYMAHQVYDKATRQDIPTITQFRDVLGLHFIVDATAPRVNIDNLTEGQRINGVIDLKGTVEDQNLLRYYYRITGNGMNVVEKTVTTDTAFTNQTIHTWNTTQYPDGEYEVRLEARDKAENKNSGSIEVIKVVVDNTPPAKVLGVRIVDNTGKELGCEGYTNNRNIQVDWDNITEEDFDHYLFDIKDKDGHKSLTNSFYNNKIRDIEGYYKFKVRAVDDLGNIGEASDWCGVTLDRIAPVVQIESPSEAETLSGTVTIRGSVQDANLSHYNISVYKGDSNVNDFSKRLLQDEKNTSEFTTKDLLTWDTTLFDNGEYQIRLGARDLAGNRDNETSIQVIRVIVDNQAPEVSEVEDIYLGEGDQIPTDIQVEVTDNNLISELCYTVTGELGNHNDCIVAPSNTNPWTIDISQMIRDAVSTDLVDTSLIPEGTYSFTYYATDSIGNQSETKSFDINVYNVAPDLTQLLPSSLSIHEGQSVQFAATFTDPSYIKGNNPDDSNWTYTAYFGDDTQTKGTLEKPDMFTFEHIYTHEGRYTVQLEVCEANSEDNSNSEFECSAINELEIEVLNDSPTVFLSPFITTVEEGSDPVIISSSVSGGNAPYTYTWTGCTNNGDLTATINTTTAGSYTCTLTVEDSDGDESSANSVVVVTEQNEEVLGTRTIQNTNHYLALGTGGPEEGDEELNEEEDLDNEDVKGVNECENKKKISGYLYVDSNTNGTRDEEERVLKGIDIKVLTGDTTIAELRTDENGYWETMACEGQYFVEVDLESLPNNTELESNVKAVTIAADTNEANVDFGVYDTRNFLEKYWPWIVLGILALGLIGTVIVGNRRRKVTY